ncbi:MAG: MarR family winged helix-turn-helix transcriptional regulator [Romboutsia sp.]|uniref:MarR family winged helix-turn-helix transcriptional regulator n=1 Tax=Romboutsia sp. TaxID=1965302 RepID=UPI003F3583BC
MNVEKYKKYKTESISRYINQLYRQSISFFGKEYKQYNIGVGQYQFLVYLYIKDGITHEELTEKLGFDKASTTRAIGKLEEYGYIKKVQDINDKRKYYIFLTDFAKENRENIINISRSWENELIGELTKEELHQFYYLFRKITKKKLENDFMEENI